MPSALLRDQPASLRRHHLVSRSVARRGALVRGLVRIPCRAGIRTPVSRHHRLAGAGAFPASRRYLALWGLRASAAHRSLPVSGRWVPSCRSCYQPGFPPGPAASPVYALIRFPVSPASRQLDRRSPRFPRVAVRVSEQRFTCRVPLTRFGGGEGRVRTCVDGTAPVILATGLSALPGVLDDLSVGRAGGGLIPRGVRASSSACTCGCCVRCRTRCPGASFVMLDGFEPPTSRHEAGALSAGSHRTSGSSEYVPDS